MNEKFNLDSKKILDQQFHIDFKGYNPKQVDAFLDLILEDYEVYEQSLVELGLHLQTYEQENVELKAKIKGLEEMLGVEALTMQPQVEQLDVLKRLTNLENEVFKK